MNNKRPRTEIHPELLSDVVYNAIINSSYSVLPLCKFALGHYIFSDRPLGSVEQHVSQLPEFHGYLKSYLTRKNYNRFVDQCKSIAESNSVVKLELQNAFRSQQNRLAHINSNALVKGEPCKTCFCTEAPILGDTMDSRFKALLTKFVQHETRQGNSFKDMYTCVCDHSFKLLSMYDKSIRSFETQLSEERAAFSRYKSELESNLGKLSDYLESISAQIYFGSDLSESNVEHLDHLIFCQEFSKSDIETYVSKLPNVNKIRSSDPQLDLNNLFKEYCSFVIDSYSEPNFLKLGQKYKLIGPKGGSSVSRLSDYAQSICLNYLLQPSNDDMYNKVRTHKVIKYLWVQCRPEPEVEPEEAEVGDVM